MTPLFPVCAILIIKYYYIYIPVKNIDYYSIKWSQRLNYCFKHNILLYFYQCCAHNPVNAFNTILRHESKLYDDDVLYQLLSLLFK